MKDNRKTPADLVALFKRLPAQNSNEAGEIGKTLVAGGAETVRQLVSLVGEVFGDPDGAKPKEALHGLVIYASRPGADDERKIVAETLAEELAAEHSDELKAFITRQFQLCGRAEEVPAIAELLISDRLCEPATQALLAIGGKEAQQSLRSALSKASDQRRATLSQAVGLLSAR
jgi:hypothetical protein